LPGCIESTRVRHESHETRKNTKKYFVGFDTFLSFVVTPFVATGKQTR
jgi:hypothetical protein